MTFDRAPSVVAPPALPTIHLAAQHSPGDLQALVAAGVWQRVRRGAYVEADYLEAQTESASQPGARHVRVRRRALAQVAAVITGHRERGTDVVLSHESAALLWGLPLWRSPERVHLVVRERRSGRAAPDVAGHRVSLGPEDLSSRGGVTVTSLERTVLDLACQRPTVEGLVVADAVLGRGVERARLEEMTHARAAARGVARAREVIALADGLAESPWESFTRLHAIAAGMPRPRLQVPIATRLGTYRADMGWDEWRGLIEFDGQVKYGELADGDPARVVFEEKRRQDAIEEAGWRFRRVTSRDFRDHRALHERMRSLAPAAGRRDMVPRPHLLLPGRSSRS
ncbi:hypothetical protein HF995_11615 [Sanguibacter hominis ATCC BAA-789]|uniref:Transcriptional regulator, AbiEi antitoxin, Type IV TA system n=1 Tax=Sanguibacter hominis ATCC BAA-789 TaxID=1312740 RepID=A0A9X5FD66_9MICO|nr:hypothetical protein [Sanguibacter hominis]NKX93909.1 hypothetical protein [Sanguibacter hominis ATCC BAA-789]